MNVPAKLEKVTEELQRTSAKKDNLLSMRSLNERIVVLKEKDIPDLEKRLVEADKVGHTGFIKIIKTTFSICFILIL